MGLLIEATVAVSWTVFGRKIYTVKKDVVLYDISFRSAVKNVAVNTISQGIPLITTGVVTVVKKMLKSESKPIYF